MTIIEELARENWVLKTIIKEAMLFSDDEFNNKVSKIGLSYEDKNEAIKKWIERCGDLNTKVTELRRQLREEVRYVYVSDRFGGGI